MNPELRKSRRFFAILLLLSGILVLATVQWSCLPILVQNGLSGGASVAVMSAGQSSKSAAPFKCLFGGGSHPIVLQSGIALPEIASRSVRIPDAPVFGQDVFGLTQNLLRAPPTA